jgi:hypothetical protein
MGIVVWAVGFENLERWGSTGSRWEIVACFAMRRESGVGGRSKRLKISAGLR